eukprot:2548490-Lingulodinium_polyedra.AAC.1
MTTMIYIGDMEPAYFSVVETVFERGAVELGWPSHLAMLLPEVTARVPDGYTYVTSFYPTGARVSVLERDDNNLTQEEMCQRSAVAQAAQ